MMISPLELPSNGYHGVLREVRGCMDFPHPPEPEAPANPLPGLAEVLSPSQVNTFLSCSARWWFHYGLKLPAIQTGSLALGKSVHAAIGANFREKIETRRDLPTAGVLAVYQDEWANQERETEFDPSEDKEELKASGAACVQKYMDEAAWKIQPKATDLHVEGSIAGVPVQGYLDILDTDGRIIDLKTANKSPDKWPRPDYRLQIATYARITPGACGHARLETLVKLKREIKLVSQSFEVTEQDEKLIDTLYPVAQAGMMGGIYTPNRSSLLCSRKYCSHWRDCEREFGGEVKGAEE